MPQDLSYEDLLEYFRKEKNWKYKSEEELIAACCRALKVRRGELLTEEEFLTEAGRCGNEDTMEVYHALAELVQSGKLTVNGLYEYALFDWCITNADAIVAYEVDPKKWVVNDCDTVISREAAVVAVNLEWGFEASRIEIFGTAYYESTDWQFVRFDCAHLSWLWKNESLYQVY